MKTIHLFIMVMLFSGGFFSCKKNEPINTTHTANIAPQEPAIDITGVYFGYRIGYSYDPVGNGGRDTVPDSYLKVDTISLDVYQFQTFDDTLFINPIWTETFYTGTEPTVLCNYSYLNLAGTNGTKNLIIRSCDSLRFSYHGYIGHGAYGYSFDGVKIH